MWAAMNGHTNIVKLLLCSYQTVQHYIDAIDENGRSALIIATIFGRYEIVYELLNANANIHISDKVLISCLL